MISGTEESGPTVVDDIAFGLDELIQEKTPGAFKGEVQETYDALGAIAEVSASILSVVFACSGGDIYSLVRQKFFDQVDTLFHEILVDAGQALPASEAVQ